MAGDGTYKPTAEETYETFIEGTDFEKIIERETRPLKTRSRYE